MEVQLRAEPEERAAEANRGAVHEDEFARHLQRAALGLQRPHHRRDLAPPVFAGADAVGDGADAVVDQRPVDEARPNVERVDGGARQIDETPAFVGVDDTALVALGQAAIEVDDAADEGGGKMRTQP